MVGLRSVLDVQKNKHLTGETRNKKNLRSQKKSKTILNMKYQPTETGTLKWFAAKFI